MKKYKRVTDLVRRSFNRLNLPIALLLIVWLLFLAVGCNRRSPAERPTREDVAVPVIVEEVELRDLAEFIRITGKLEGIRDVNMVSETTGRILTLNKILGDWIEEGEELGTLDNEVYRIRLEQARAALASANAQLESAAMSYRTTNRLYESGSVSQAEYQQALFAHQSAIAQRDGAAAALESAQKTYNDSRLRAPISGYITSLNLKVGETIFPNTLIAGIVDYRKLLMKGSVSEHNIQAVRKDQAAFIEYQGEEFSASVRGLGMKPSSNSASYPVEIIMNNDEGKLIPGMVVSANIKVNINESVIYTDTSNIRSRYDEHFVYIIDEDNLARRRKVTRGRVINEFTIIISGLNVGDRLVVEGIDSLEEGSRVNIRS